MTSDIEELQEILFRDQKNFFFKKKLFSTEMSSSGSQH